MCHMSLAEVAEVLGARRVGGDAQARFASVSTDSRTLRQDDLFIALQGPNFDGHDYVAQAQARGAAAAVVARELDATLPLLIVDDTRLALGRLAAAWRAKFPIPVVAVTGSNGKTTVKEMIAAILDRRGQTLATRGNLNNDIGVPLTLLRLRSEHRYAVIEMGANHAGEIGYVTDLARPTVALITNAGPAHLEGFGSIEGVARAKGEIYRGLASGGVALINADDRYADLWRQLAAPFQQITFGTDPSANVNTRADAIELRLSNSTPQMVFPLRTAVGEVEIALPLPGRHNVTNALAAAAAALAVGATLADIKDGLESMEPVSGRLQIRKGAAGAYVIDDTYNANPASLGAGLEVLGAFEGARWLVIGDMGELGASAPALHEQAGHEARAARVDRLFALGANSRLAATAFGSGAAHYERIEDLIEALRSQLHNHVAVLVKGSRFMRMERVVAALMTESDNTVGNSEVVGA